MPQRKDDSVEIPFVDGLKAAEIQDISLEDISRGDTTFQYRFSSNLRDLKQSLPREGQTEPIDLTGSKPYRIIDGFRRVEAIRALGWATVKALVHRGISDEDAHKLAFVKNVVRKNLSPVEKAHAILLAKQRGMKTAKLVEQFGLSEKQLSRYEALLTFPPELQKLLDKGELSMAHASVLSAFKVRDLDGWVNRIGEEGLSTRQLKRELRKASGARPAGRPKLYLKREKGGIRMYPFTVDKDAPRAEKDKVIKLLQGAIEVLKE